MKPLFTISRLGAQNKMPNVDTIIKESDLTLICQRLTGNGAYEVTWINKRIKGKMFTLETEKHKYFITYTPKEVGGRNSYLQSVPTAFAQFLADSSQEEKLCHFCLYFTPFRGENQTPYHQFIYRLLYSIGVKFINPDTGIRGLRLTHYNNVRELIDDRERNRERNAGNRSSYITDEGAFFHIYGKTFGANQKETTLICYALSKISEKPIKLFQISDNGVDYLSDTDVQGIKRFAQSYGQSEIEVLDDTYEFNEDESNIKRQTSIQENLRTPRFIFNLLQKTSGHKCCELCHCEIESIIQGAHIYPISAIKKRADLSFEEKLELATDKENGLWLCENHHKLFDNGLIRFDNGIMRTMPKLSHSDIMFVETISTHHRIKKEYYTQAMKEYFDKRDEYYYKERIYSQRALT